jgi:hypothetical protein
MKKEKVITMEQHIGMIHQKMCLIPDIVDTKKDQVLWDIMFTCNFIFIELFENYIIDDNSINILVGDYNNDLVIIDDICNDKSKVFLINIYFIMILEYCEKYCLEAELYETCANIKKFVDAL